MINIKSYLQIESIPEFLQHIFTDRICFRLLDLCQHGLVIGRETVVSFVDRATVVSDVGRDPLL